MYKKYSMTFILGHPFGMSGSYDQFFDPSHIPPFCAHVRVWSTPAFCICDLIDLIPNSPVLTFCFTSKIPKCMTHLK